MTDNFMKNRINIGKIIGKIQRNMDFIIEFVYYNTKTKNYECYAVTYGITSSLEYPSFEEMYNNGDMQIFDNKEEFLYYFKEICYFMSGKNNDWQNLEEHIDYVYNLNNNISKSAMNKCIARLQYLKTQIMEKQFDNIKNEWPVFDTRGILRISKNAKILDDYINNTKDIFSDDKITNEFIEYKITSY
jgi:hypothetical protein